MTRTPRTIELPDVVVTGVGAVTALGTGAQTLHRRWLAGEDGIAGGLARASDFDPEAGMTAKEVRRSDRYTQLAVAAAEEALAMAGWGADPPYDPFRVATMLGTGIGGIGTLESQFDVLRDSGPRRLSALGVPMMMPNAAAATIAMRRSFHGPALGTVSACAAGANAIGTALRMLQYGEVDAAVAGGSEAAITPYSTAAFGGMGTLSALGISRPFDARRDGFVLGEGAGVLVLERKADALRRGATVLAELRGYASTVDGYHLTAPDPSGAPAAAAMSLALADAGLQPADVSYVNAHGTSTPLNDQAEAGAIRTALGPHAGSVPISSTKSAVGHLLGAAGSVEAVATVLALHEGVAGATLGYEEVDPLIGEDLDVIAGSPRDLPAGERVALSNSFGFGGHNAVLCLSSEG
ncbi:MAG TPA: beta-ketoacyl-[acyl-carrier-protein] synthase family protein [Baekduia sp.]|uniref:beta-ketoacyl-[acyl-carrier-protein] synthase family protein n=1 Tax=Baekduia sp. TaxID=2600305 RepID=UPI002C0547B1|nr:beta-ketoacyl-[acyl-carrier-protein] synthase family protein [Baekduia sp.]HMJ36980.1 beta-ketoacyl-[acyl-carrier-protein] synthase family protein [Baekduia sp.]